MNTLRLLFAAFLLCVVASAQSASRDDSAAVTTVIHAAHLLDVKTGRMVDGPTIVVRGGKILNVSASQPDNLPPHAIEIDLPNATLRPGLIDAHTHLTSDANFGYQQLGVSDPKDALIGAKNSPLTLEPAVTP